MWDGRRRTRDLPAHRRSGTRPGPRPDPHRRPRHAARRIRRGHAWRRICSAGRRYPGPRADCAAGSRSGGRIHHARIRRPRLDRPSCPARRRLTSGPPVERTMGVAVTGSSTRAGGPWQRSDVTGDGEGLHAPMGKCDLVGVVGVVHGRDDVAATGQLLDQKGAKTAVAVHAGRVHDAWPPAPAAVHWSGHLAWVPSSGASRSTQKM